MRLGVLTTSYPRDADNPAGAFVAGFAEWLTRAGHVVDVVAAGERPLFADPKRGGAPEQLGRGRGWLSAAAFTARLYARAAARAPGWDAIVSHWLVPSGVVGAALAAGRPHLAIAHGSDVRLLARLPGGRALCRALARRADLVYVAEDLRIDGAPGRVVPMAVDVASLAGGARATARRALGLDGFTVLVLARLVRDKGVDLAIDALPGDMTLVVAGDGPERAALEKQARGRRVRFVGEVRGAHKRDLLAAADALVIPSRRDGAPTVALEGLAAGVPIVATRVGGLPELLADGETALLCAPEVAALSRALARLADPALAERLATAARQAARAHDWSVVGPRLAGSLHDRQIAAREPGTLLVSRV